MSLEQKANTPWNVVVSNFSVSLPVGVSVRVSGKVYNELGLWMQDAEVHFASLDTGIATATMDGLITGVRPGVVKVMAEYRSVFDSVMVTVTGITATQADSVAFDQDSVVIDEGRSLQLHAAVFDSTGQPRPDTTARFVSRNPSIAMTTAWGLVIGARLGSTYIVASSGRGRDSVRVRVTRQAYRVEIQPHDVRLVPGQQLALSATVWNEDSTPVAGAQVQFSENDWDNAFGLSPSGVLTGQTYGRGFVVASFGWASDTVQVRVDDASVMQGYRLRYIGGHPFALAMAGSTLLVTQLDDRLLASFRDGYYPFTTTPTRDGPIDVAVSPDSLTAYVLNETDRTVSAITLSSGTARTWTTGDTPRRIQPSADGGKLYVTTASGDVRILDRSNGALLATVGVATAPAGGMTQSADGRKLYVTSDSGDVVEVDVAAREVVRTWHIGVRPAEVAVTGSGLLLVADSAGPLQRIDLATGQTDFLLSVIGAVAVTPVGRDSAAAIVIKRSSSHVLLLDGSGNPLRGWTLPAGSRPRRVVAAANGLYVTDENGFFAYVWF